MTTLGDNVLVRVLEQLIEFHGLLLLTRIPEQSNGAAVRIRQRADMKI